MRCSRPVEGPKGTKRVNSGLACVNIGNRLHSTQENTLIYVRRGNIRNAIPLRD